MNTISAIETTYKGYRFRSRLEARWAMFFDRTGVRWTYEVEPLRIGSEAYLPDFLVDLGRGTPVTHEVKSLHEAERIRPARVYLAGKMSEAHDWRQAPETETEGRWGGYEGQPWRHLSDVWAAESRVIRWGYAAFLLRGPHYLGGQHGTPLDHDELGLHSAVAPYASQQKEIFAACMEAIADSDLFCAHFSTADAFGSLVELGVARALGKPIGVTITRDLAIAMRREDAGHRTPGAHDLWFAEAAAKASAVVEDAAEARKLHTAMIAEWTPREYRVISAIGATRPAVMTFGDPLDIANRGKAHDFGFTGLAAHCIRNRAAAEAVRAHRFDGR